MQLIITHASAGELVLSRSKVVRFVHLSMLSSYLS